MTENKTVTATYTAATSEVFVSSLTEIRVRGESFEIDVFNFNSPL